MPLVASNGGGEASAACPGSATGSIPRTPHPAGDQGRHKQMIDPSRNLARCARPAPRRSTRPTAWRRIETGLSMVFAAGGGREQILGSKGPRPGPTRTATRCGREPQQPANPRSTGPRPAQSFVDRVVVDAEVLRDRADANAAVTHRRGPRRDRLVDRRLDRLGEIRLNLNLGNGAKPLRTRPRWPCEASRAGRPVRLQGDGR